MYVTFIMYCVYVPCHFTNLCLLCYPNEVFEACKEWRASVSPSRYTAKNASNASGFNNDQDESDNIRSITVVFYTSIKSAALESAPFYRLACFFDSLYITFYRRSKFIKGMEHKNIFLIYIYVYARIHICAY